MSAAKRPAAARQIIELRRVGFLNKGAELMLLAILARMRARYSGLEYALAPAPEAPFGPRARLGLWQKWELRFRGLNLDALGACLPTRLRERYGLVLDRELTAVLDAAGFAYSDQWGVYGQRRCRELASQARRCARLGVPLILLPQAFGPFHSQGSQRAMRAVLAHASLIFARDEASERALKALGDPRGIVRRSPDFTPGLLAAEEVAVSVGPRPFFIVPNGRMVDRGASVTGAQYEAFLATLARCAKAVGCAPYFLLHEGAGDQALVDAVNGRLDEPLPQILEADPLRLKAYLGASEGGFADRYHALVGALSQGVPAFGAGWSHKYSALFEDFGWPEGQLSLEGSETALAARLGDALGPSQRSVLSAALAVASARLQAQADAMWAQVDACLAEAGLKAEASP